jgi:hypothetical protein
MLTGGVCALLLTTGCASTPGTGAAQSTTGTADTTTTAAPASTAAPTAASAASAQASRKYAERLVLGATSVKAGGSLPVSGGTLKPGTKVKVYAAQQMVATYNPATDMWGSAQGEVLLSNTATAVVDAQGHYDVQLVIRAGTPHQTFNVNLILPDGNGSLLQANVD